MSSWQDICHFKRELQAGNIPYDWRLKSIPEDYKSSIPIVESCGVLNAEELEITNIDASILVSKLQTGELTSVKVVTAFCKRAAVLQQLTKCCTELMFSDAIETAERLDEEFAKTGKPTGPLHGLPISLKDCCEVEGYDTCVGWAGLCFKPAEQDSVSTIAQTRRLGAVLYVKTNLPQSMMMSDSYNHVFGQSVNSLHRGLVSGGSSGGEGALVGGRGSVIGIGTDIGGSIRIPAALQGIYGLCSSAFRVSWRRAANHQDYLINSVAGPLTWSLDSLKTYMEAYCSSNPWDIDPSIPPIPWRMELTKPPTGRKLKLGFIHDDGYVLPQPPVQRAMSHVRELFTKAGHECIDWDSFSQSTSYYELWEPAILADGGEGCKAACKLSDPEQPLIEGMLVGKPEDKLDVAQRQALARKILNYKQMYAQKMLESGVDAIIAPVLPWVGYKPKQWVVSNQYVGYSAHWNLLDYSALAVPTGVFADKELDSVEACPGWKEYSPKNMSDEFNHQQYDLDLVEGMPIGLQIVTGHYKEEQAVMVAGVLEELRRSS
ncbi:amidase [Aureobasidium pullulans]|nr:amidase [Aureobasidium pullulans]